MAKQLILISFCLNLLCVPAVAHQIGFGDQILQPNTVVHALLPLLAVGLLCRQQPKVPINRIVAFMLGLGLAVGVSFKVYVNPSQTQLIFALVIAGLAGSCVALAYPLPNSGLSLFILALGIAIGTNLSFETTDWIDLSQTGLGAFVGAIAVLYVMATMAVPATRNWHQVGIRVIGSWICACAIMILALGARNPL